MKVKDLRKVIDDLVEEYELDVQKTYVYLEVCNDDQYGTMASFYPLVLVTAASYKTKPVCYLEDAKIEEGDKKYEIFKKTLGNLIEELDCLIDKGHENCKMFIYSCIVKRLSNNLSCFVTNTSDYEYVFVISGYMCNEKCLLED